MKGISQSKSYGYALYIAVSHMQLAFVNYNFISIEVAMKLFKKADPETYSSLSSTRYFDSITEKNDLLPKKLVKFIDDDWKTTQSDFEDVLVNANNHAWDDVNYPAEKVYEMIDTHVRAYESWKKNPVWNNIKEVIKYGTEDQRIEYWKFMSELKSRLDACDEFVKKVYEILDTHFEQ